MSNQSPSKSDMTNCSVTGDSNGVGFEPIRNFEWATRLEKCLLLNMTRLKPCGINKHLSVLLLKEKMTKELQVNVPIKVLWNYLSSKWNIKAADIIEDIPFDTSEKDFQLPEEFDQLIAEEGQKIKRLDEERKLDEKNKLKYLEQLNKTTSNQSKDVEKIEKISNRIGRKRKIRHESESSFFSDNKKQCKTCKNNLTDLTI